MEDLVRRIRLQLWNPYVLPYLMNPDFALRYEYPGNVSAALQQGYLAEVG